jgi:hypothetical protein
LTSRRREKWLWTTSRRIVVDQQLQPISYLAGIIQIQVDLRVTFFSLLQSSQGIRLDNGDFATSKNVRPNQQLEITFTC